MRPVVKQILLFLVLVTLFSAFPYALMISEQTMRIAGGYAVYAVMWCPTLAALVCCAVFRIDLASLGWSWRPSRYVAIGYITPVLYAFPVYVLAWIFIPAGFIYDTFAASEAKSWGLADWPNLALWVFAVPAQATIGVIRSLSSALGEEIGWRGFLLPRLVAVRGYNLGCLLAGLIWAAWHVPAILWVGYEAGTPKLYEIACFAISVVATTYILGWLRLRSNSLWPCAMLHATHNLFIQHIFDGMTASEGAVTYVTTEFGCGLAITISIAAFLFWRQHGRLVLPTDKSFA